MRIQFDRQSLRLRIDEGELARLLDRKTVENTTYWPDGREAVWQVRVAKSIAWQRTRDGWRLNIPEDEVRRLSEKLPSREGLSWDVPIDESRALRVVFDVDIKDSARRLRARKKAAQ